MIELLVQLGIAWFFQHILILGVMCSLMVMPFWICAALMIVLFYPYLMGLMKIVKYIGKPIDDDVFNILSVISVLILFGSNLYETLDANFWQGMILGIQQYIVVGVFCLIYVLCVVRYLLLKFEIVKK